MNVKIIKIAFLYLLFMTPFTLKGEVVFVNINANGDETGNTWANAYSDLSIALINFTVGDSIWVANGVYFPTNDVNRYATFTIEAGVSLFGGFIGTESSITERDLSQGETILSGNLGLSGPEDNSLSVLIMPFPNENTELNGFTIKGGNSNSLEPGDSFNSSAKNGGGLFIEGHSSEISGIIRNCKFESNISNRRGGAIHINTTNGGKSNTKIDNCVFISNGAFNGSCVSLRGGLGNVFNISNTTFENNSVQSLEEGGMILITSENDTGYIGIEYCNFINNVGTNINVEISNFGSLESFITNVSYCTFEDNAGTCFRQIDNIFDLTDAISQVNIDYCSFFNNNVSDLITVTGVGYLQVQNTIFEENFSNSTILIDETCNNFSLKNASFRNNSNGLGSIRGYNHNLWILNSIFDDNQGQCIYLGRNEGGQKVDIVNSIFSNNTLFFENQTVIRLEGDSSELIVSHCDFINNINIENTPQDIGAISFGQNHEIITENSIFYNDEMVGIPFLLGGTELQVNNSLFSQNNIEEVWSNYSLLSATVNHNENLFNSNPLFNQLDENDYSLQRCSPAINKGRIQTVNNISTDIIGNNRIHNTYPDLGAYEAPEFKLLVANVYNSDCFLSNGSVLLDTNNGCEPVSFYYENENEVISQTNELAANVYLFFAKDSIGRKDSVFVEVNTKLTGSNFQLNPNILSIYEDAKLKNCSSESISFSLFDISGRLLLTGKSSDTVVQINLPDLAGIYFLKVFDSMRVNHLLPIIVQ